MFTAAGCLFRIGFVCMAKLRSAAGRAQINYSLVVSSGFLLAVPGRGRGTTDYNFKCNTLKKVDFILTKV